MKTSKYLTKYEETRVIGLRGLQISNGAPILVETNGETDPLRIARLELRNRVLPMTIRRTLPDGTIEDVRINDLIVR